MLSTSGLSSWPWRMEILGCSSLSGSGILNWVMSSSSWRSWLIQDSWTEKYCYKQQSENEMYTFRIRVNYFVHIAFII